MKRPQLVCTQCLHRTGMLFHITGSTFVCDACKKIYRDRLNAILYKKDTQRDVHRTILKPFRSVFIHE